MVLVLDCVKSTPQTAAFKITKELNQNLGDDFEIMHFIKIALVYWNVFVFSVKTSLPTLFFLSRLN